MNETQDSKSSRNTRRSIFWPLILITLGIIFLLKNTGVLTGESVNSLIKFWPVILILMGLDSIFRREGWVGSTLVIALGVLFLLSNFGYFSISIWEVLFRLWPLFLVAAGLDILIGKRSWILSLLALLLILGILAGSLWIMGSSVASVEPVTTSQVQQTLEGATRARVEINQDAGSIKLGATNDPDLLLVGVIPGNQGQSLGKDFSVQDGKATLVLRSSGNNFLSFKTKQSSFEFDLNSQVPLDLAVKLGAGEIGLDLLQVNISNLNVEMGVGETKVNLPGNASFTGNLQGAIGQLVIYVPQNVGLKIVGETALVNVDIPPGFTEENGIYTSPNYDQANTKIQLSVGLAIGSVTIQVK